MGKKIRRSGWKEYFNQDCMRINLNVSDLCNFSCSYCINGNVHKTRRVLDKTILGNFIEDLAERNRESYIFGVTGGEPLIYPHLDFLVDKIDKTVPNNKHICILSNGSLLLEKAEPLYAYAENTILTFSLGLHLERLNIKEYVNKIAKFSHIEDVTCKIMLVPGMYSQTKKALEALKANNITTLLAPLREQNGEPFNYSVEEQDLLAQYTHLKDPVFFLEYENGETEDVFRVTKGMHPEKMDFAGMNCLAGRNSLGLGPDGFARRCFWAGKECFNLAERRLRDIPELDSPCTCISHYCNCDAFLRMPKWRNEEDAPLYIHG